MQWQNNSYQLQCTGSKIHNS